MINLATINKNLIGVSLISSLMVFWLGGRYLSDAHTQFSGAKALQRSITTEATLFDIAHRLDQERAIIQRLLIGADEFDDGLEKLESLSANTHQLAAQLHTKMSRSLGELTDKQPHWHSRQSIEHLLEELEDRFNRKSISISILKGQLYLPHATRDESIRVQMFDTYSSLIDTVNNLRKRSHTLPANNFREVLSAHEIKNAIWIVDDAISQTSTLIESFLLKYHYESLESLNVENLVLRTVQQHQRATQAIKELAEMVQHRDIAGVSSAAVEALQTQYESAFRKRVRQHILTTPDPSESSNMLVDWETLANDTKSRIRGLVDAALLNTSKTAESIRASTGISLLFNSLLVLMCMVMAYATYRVARTIQYQADHDDLTGIPNRRSFNKLLETQFRKTDSASDEKLVLMTLDLNGFKSINDTMGHVAGDALLTQVASRLNGAIESHMTLARMGGDEFAIAYKTGKSTDLYDFACRIRDVFNRSFHIEDGLVKIDTSIGYSVYPDDADSLQTLQITSDFAMFSAKQSGRKTIQPFNRSVADQFAKRVAIEKDLVNAIDNDELELYYQPQFNLKLNCANAVEALIRWNHPQRGLVSPVDFIDIAEETGQMPAIGNWVLEQACKQIAKWHIAGELPVRVAVNVSVHQIMQSEFVESVLGTIERYRISPSHLELEITESVAMADINWIVHCLETLKGHGVRIALDDFGTGYSSLNQIQELPLDTLKIDRSFISKLGQNDDNMKSVTATIVSIAEIYQLETVAEGIESSSQIAELDKLGIDIAQGYYFSKPLPEHQVAAAINEINTFAVSNLIRAA